MKQLGPIAQRRALLKKQTRPLAAEQYRAMSGEFNALRRILFPRSKFVRESIRRSGVASLVTALRRSKERRLNSRKDFRRRIIRRPWGKSRETSPRATCFPVCTCALGHLASFPALGDNNRRSRWTPPLWGSIRGKGEGRAEEEKKKSRRAIDGRVRARLSDLSRERRWIPR